MDVLQCGIWQKIETLSAGSRRFLPSSPRGRESRLQRWVCGEVGLDPRDRPEDDDGEGHCFRSRCGSTPGSLISPLQSACREYPPLHRHSRLSALCIKRTKGAEVSRMTPQPIVFLPSIRNGRNTHSSIYFLRYADSDPNIGRYSGFGVRGSTFCGCRFSSPEPDRWLANRKEFSKCSLFNRRVSSGSPFLGAIVHVPKRPAGRGASYD